LEARKSFRSAVEELKFPAYSKVVTPALHDTTKLAKLTRSLTTDKQVAVQQHAHDIIASSRRAVALRNKTFLDHVADAKAARPMQDRYEESRLARYESERF
jgi:HD superfamily phosphodiesterase